MKNEIVQEVRKLVEQLIRGESEGQDWLKQAKFIDSLVKLPGDASDRRYYRIGSRHRSYILMRTEPFAVQGAKFPFLVVQQHLAGCGVDVPEVVDVDPEQGSVLLEDLGDVTLLRRLQEVSSSEVERHLYERVLDSLVQLQVSASPKAGVAKELDAFKLYFNFEKLMWEVNFAIEHFYQLHLKRSISDADRQVMDKGFSEIVRFLAAQPTVLAHRDFHSRNIMIASGADHSRKIGPSPADPAHERFVMIDFQDARMGPPQYDLVSLLRDSYYQLEELQIFRLVDYYIARFEANSGARIDRHQFMRTFDLMAVQRNFKAIGSFASFLNRRGNATYLKYIGNTFENIRRTLLKYPEYSGLREVLFHYYYF